jgi:hypothetical protein
MNREEVNAMKTGSIVPFAAAVILAVFANSVRAGGTYSGGTGEPSNPYRIATANDLNDIGNHADDWNKHFLMVDDINLADYNGIQFNIIGEWIHLTHPNNRPFTGVFDGNDNAILNFSYTVTDANGIGLFGYVADGGEVKNLALIDANIKVVDTNLSDSSYYYCSGSLVGMLRESTVSGCRARGGAVSGNLLVGGLIGKASYGYVIDSNATNTVSGLGGVGGLIGETYRGSVLECHATGTVTGYGGAAGGLIAQSNSETTRCYATGSVVSGGNYAGGLVGGNLSIISECHSTGSVSGDSYVGGLVGDSWEFSTVASSYATGNVSGTERIGGLVGYNKGYVSNSYAEGAVSGTDKVGGLVGDHSDPYADADITHCYATGAVDGSTDVGGLVGYNFRAEITSSFWDVQTSGKNSMCGDCYNSGCDYCDDGDGKATAEMQMESTFTDAGWDFVEVWDIGENQTYPFLRVYPPGDLNHDNMVNFIDVAILADHWLEEE